MEMKPYKFLRLFFLYNDDLYSTGKLHVEFVSSLICCVMATMQKESKDIEYIMRAAR